MKRPLLPVALWYSAGIVLAHFADAPLAPLFVVALASLFLCFFWTSARSILVAAALFFIGWANLAWRTAVISPHDLRVLAGDRPAEVTLRGFLCGAPSQRVTVREESEFWHTLAPVEVSAVRFGRGDWQPAVGTVNTSTRGSEFTNLFVGQPVEVSGVLSPPPGAVAKGLFDYAAYLRSLGIYHQLQVESAAAWQVVGGTNATPWTERFRLWAQGTMGRGLPEIDEPLKLQWAMVLGWKTALTGEVSEPFMRSGTMHIFAISGLHIALISGILLALFRLFNLPRGLCGAVVVPLIWFYTAATEWQASAIRSTVMMTIIIAGWSLRRPGDLLNSLAAAAFVILLWDPAQLFQAGFQLSFGAVLSLALFMPFFDRWRQRLLFPALRPEPSPPLSQPLASRPDNTETRLVQPLPLLPGEQRQNWRQRLGSFLLERARRLLLVPDAFLPAPLWPWWQRHLVWMENRLLQALSVSAAATLGTAPLIAYYFHLFTPVSLFSNLVVVPLSGFALMSGLGGLICGGWMPWASELFNHAGWFFMLCMAKASAWSIRLPAAYCYVKPPGVLLTILYYAALATWLGGWLAGRRRALALAVLGMLAAAWLGLAWHDSRATRVTVLPLSGGHAVWVEAPGRGGDWLVDCGDARAVERITLPFLRGQGVRRLSHLVLTHGDIRHVGGSTNLLADPGVKALCASPASFRSVPYRQALQAWTNSHRPLTALSAGDTRGPWTVLHPRATDRFPRADDEALVFQGRFGGTRLLLLSDLGPAGQNALLQRHPDLRADIVVTGLPAGAEPLHSALIEAIRPQLILVADCDQPARARAGPALVARLTRCGVPVLFLHDTAAVSLQFGSGKWAARTMNGLKLQRSPN